MTDLKKDCILCKLILENPWRAAAVVLGVVLLFALFGCGTAQADDLNISWQHPAQRVDGTALPLSEIQHTTIEWGLCSGNNFPATPAGTRDVAAPSTTTSVTGVGYGTWCVRGKTVDTGGRVSDNSNVAQKIILAPPNPPLIVTVESVAYEIKLHPVTQLASLGRQVGVIAYGVPCVDNPMVETGRGTYYEVPADKVLLTKDPKSSVVVARCAVL